MIRVSCLDELPRHRLVERCTLDLISKSQEKTETVLTESKTVEIRYNLELINASLQTNDIAMYSCQRALFALFAFGKAVDLQTAVGAKKEQREVRVRGDRDPLRCHVSFLGTLLMRRCVRDLRAVWMRGAAGGWQ